MGAAGPRAACCLSKDLPGSGGAKLLHLSVKALAAWSKHVHSHGWSWPVTRAVKARFRPWLSARAKTHARCPIQGDAPRPRNRAGRCCRSRTPCAMGYRDDARLHFGRQTARSFRDDLKAARDSVKRPHVSKEALVGKALGEGICKVDIEKDIGQAGAFGVRKHRSRQQSPMAAPGVSDLRGSRHRQDCRTCRR